MPKITGVITNIQVKNQDKYITVKDGKKEVTVSFQGFLWVYRDDIIEAIYDRNTYECKELPIVHIPINIYKLSNILYIKQKYPKSHTTDFLTSLKNVMGKLGDILPVYADRYMESKYINKTLLHVAKQNNITTGFISNMFFTIYKDINLRKLYNLGIKSRDITNSMIFPTDMFNILKDNPLKLYTLEYDKIKYIMELLEIEIYQKDILYNSLVNTCYNKLITFKQICYLDRKLHKYDKTKLEEFGLYYNETYKYYSLVVVNNIENTIVDILYKIKNKPKPVINIPELDSELSDNQKDAINMALTNNLSIIYGAAGTGKTTIIKNIVDILDKNQYFYVLTSFTGRAVCILRNKTGKDAYTMHSIFTSGIPIESKKIKDNIYLIIDEMSMVDTYLLYRTLIIFRDSLKILPRIIFVGDTNQFEPISWGRIFEQLINSNSIIKTFLSKNYRVNNQDGSANGIIINSEAIARKYMLDNDFFISDNFDIISGTKNLLYNTIEKLKINIKDFIIITPYVKDMEEINLYVQKILNKQGEFVKDLVGNKWYLGDKVMVYKNNTHHKIYNGQEGNIIGFKKEQLIVKLDGRKEKFFFNITNKKNKNEEYDNIEKDDDEVSSPILFSHNLRISYCITGHKSEGGEWKYVFIYIPPVTNNVSFLDRNMLYTIITRASSILTIIGSVSTLKRMRYKTKYVVKEFMSKKIKDKLEEIEQIEKEDQNEDFEKSLTKFNIGYVPPQNKESEENTNYVEDDEVLLIF